MRNKIYNSDCIEGLKTLPDESVDCCVTSPPYFGLRDYGHEGQIGLEETPEAFVGKMVEVFTEVKRVLKKEGTLWLNLGDSYATGTKAARQEGNKGLGLTTEAKEARDIFRIGTPEGMKTKDLIGVPWMVAFALRSSGWYLRQDIIWHKPNPMPESVTDRCTKAHEYIFLLSKSQKYFYDNEAIKEEAVTYENRPSGVVRNREYGYDSKENNNPEAYMKQKFDWSAKGECQTLGELNEKMKRVKLGDKSFSKGQAVGKGVKPSGNGKKEYYEVPLDRNKRSVWTVTTKPFSEAHFATFPEDLIVDCIKAGCPEEVCIKCGKARERVVEKSKYEPPIGERFVDESRGDKTRKLSGSDYHKQVKVTGEYFTDCGCNAGFTSGIVLDPFSGAGTTALVASKLNRDFIGFELNAEYIEITKKRLQNELGMFNKLIA